MAIAAKSVGKHGSMGNGGGGGKAIGRGILLNAIYRLKNGL